MKSFSETFCMQVREACDFVTHLQHAEILQIFKTLILIISGFLIARVTKQAAQRLLSRYISSQQTMVLQKIIYFSVLMLFIIAAFQQLGFQLSVLLGSAGIATAAIAIASQTSISNIVSGLFLILEKSFKIGDRIKVGSTTGVVSSIDLLSVKILTVNNTLIRIPNESLIKSEIINLTRFESRRLDLIFNVKVDQDIPKIKQLLTEVATQNRFSLKTPVASTTIKEIEDSDVSLQLSVWVLQTEYDILADSLYQEVLLVFTKHEIQM